MLIIKQKIESFTSSTITQTYDDYDSTKTYTLETDENTLTSASVCRFGNYYYRSVIDGNIGNNPAETEGVFWVLLRYSNQMAMINTSSYSKSVVEDTDLVVEFNRYTINSLAIGNFTASSVTIEHLDSSGVVIPEFTQEFTYSVNEEVYDYYDYMYAEYSSIVDRGIYINIPQIGVKLRVTLAKSTEANIASCGFLVGGANIDCGETLDGVSLSFNSFASKEYNEFGDLSLVNRPVQDLVDFETLVRTKEIQKTRKKTKDVYNDVVVFVLDPSETSEFDNLVGLGVIDSADLVGQFNSTHSIMSFSVFESI